MHKPEEDGKPSETLRAIFEPESVAIIGASDDSGRIGGRPLRYLLEAGFAGGIYPVNPNRDQVQGIPAYPDIRAVPVQVDLAIIALPADQVLSVLPSCAEKGVKAAIIFSAGFGETDAAGAALQAEMLALARRLGLRVLGPNCLGAFNAHTGFMGTFTQALKHGFLAPGSVAIASQSGACGGHLAYLCRQRGIGVGYWITTGNEADIGLPECMHWLAQHPTVRVIVAYAEAIRDGDGFVKALKLARSRGKAVVVLKVGRSAAGARAAASHTGALAGEDAVYDAVFRQYGVYRAGSVEELLDIAYACSHGVFPPDRSLGIVTVSGGVGVQMADAAAEYGLETPLLPADAQASIKAMIPFAGVTNPIDVTAQAANDKSLLGRCLEVVMGEGSFGAVVLFVTSAPADPDFAQRLLAVLGEIRKRHPGRLIVLSFVAPQTVVREFEAAGFLVFEDSNRAVRAIGALAAFARSFQRAASGPFDAPAPAERTYALTRGDIDGLNEQGAKALLAAAGIPVLDEILSASAEAAGEAAERIGCPVALKIVSPDITHKTEVGGVVLDIPTPELAVAAARDMLARVRGHLPAARVDGVLVSPMRRGGTETLCGVFRDPVFGPVLMFGLGGVHVEVLKDVAMRLVPLDRDEARSMVRELRGKAIFDGVRGAPPADVEALIDVLVRLSAFADSQRNVVGEVDINPLLLMPQGQGAIALDALVLPVSE
ncbi:CoA-binding protein [Cupriavidus necator]|uniref:CoA-binding protein n=1 Tax=Cupriavidus necator TaxID=106590 RepID=A0A1U9UVJ7_CUPNE|nr:acetate--CoA ligase family protein [Cupriavidus necator]AQV96716.1 CoA-binding protein [Cupriavidus necator]